MNPADTEALKALVADATALQKQLDDGDGAYPQDYHDIFGKLEAALPALERMLASQTQDMVLVPREPTEEMILAAGPAIDAYYDGTKDAPFSGSVIAAYKAMVAAAPIASEGAESSCICPICGKDSPHYHGPEEATMYNAKFVGVGPQFVQDALQHVYAAMDAMRRKGARENYDRGYNAGFNVSADILEAALKDIKSKLGWMAERTGEFPPIVFDAETAANKVPVSSAPMASQMGEPVWYEMKDWKTGNFFFSKVPRPDSVALGWEQRALYAAPTAGMDADSAAREIEEAEDAAIGRDECGLSADEIAAIIRKHTP